MVLLRNSGSTNHLTPTFRVPIQRITESSVKPALKGVRRALLDADVNVNVADTLIEGVKTRSLGKEVLEGVTAEQQFIKAMYDELLDMMGGDSATAVSTERTFMPAATLAYNTDRPTVVLLGTCISCGNLGTVEAATYSSCA